MPQPPACPPAFGRRLHVNHHSGRGARSRPATSRAPAKRGPPGPRPAEPRVSWPRSPSAPRRGRAAPPAPWLAPVDREGGQFSAFAPCHSFNPWRSRPVASRPGTHYQGPATATRAARLSTHRPRAGRTLGAGARRGWHRRRLPVHAGRALVLEPGSSVQPADASAPSGRTRPNRQRPTPPKGAGVPGGPGSCGGARGGAARRGHVGGGVAVDRWPIRCHSLRQVVFRPPLRRPREPGPDAGQPDHPGERLVGHRSSRLHARPGSARHPPSGRREPR